MSRKELAEKLGVSVQTVGEWVRGDTRPDLVNMAKLEDLRICGMRAWTEPDSEPVIHDGGPSNDDA